MDIAEKYYHSVSKIISYEFLYTDNYFASSTHLSKYLYSCWYNNNIEIVICDQNDYSDHRFRKIIKNKFYDCNLCGLSIDIDIDNGKAYVDIVAYKLLPYKDNKFFHIRDIFDTHINIDLIDRDRNISEFLCSPSTINSTDIKAITSQTFFKISFVVSLAKLNDAITSASCDIYNELIRLSGDKSGNEHAVELIKGFVFDSDKPINCSDSDLQSIRLFKEL